MSKIGEWLKDTFVGEGADEGEMTEDVRGEDAAGEPEIKKAPIRRASNNPNNVVNINQTIQLQVVLEHPESYEQATEIAEHINSKAAVVLNLESTNKDVARRILDFLTGVAFANGGKVQRVSNSTYIIIPNNVGLVGGEIMGELESNGIYI